MINAVDKKSQIIDAAKNLFSRYGFSKTSLDEIAREACLGKGTIYYYFESKEDIFFEAVKVNSEKFYEYIQKEIDKQKDFDSKLSASIRLPFKIIYQHAPLLLDAFKNMSHNYLQKLDQFREVNRKRMKTILTGIISEGIEQGKVNPAIPLDQLVNIIYDWFLLGDTNIIVKNPDEFVKKAELEYDRIVQLLLYGIVRRG